MNKHSVKFIRGSKTIWDQLNTTPEKIDNNTLYFIYEDENYSVGKLYLGQRLITDDKIINIKDIGDIQIDDESLIDKQILIYNEENQEWKNSSLEEIIDLSNYYTKNETDNNISIKMDYAPINPTAQEIEDMPDGQLYGDATNHKGIIKGGQEFYDTNYIDDALAAKEDTANKVTAISAENKASATQFPTVGAIVGFVENSYKRVFTSTTNPPQNQDTQAPYVVGDTWINTTDQTSWVLERIATYPVLRWKRLTSRVILSEYPPPSYVDYYPLIPLYCAGDIWIERSYYSSGTKPFYGLNGLYICVGEASQSEPPYHRHNFNWYRIITAQSTLAGYGITDAYTKTEIDAMIGDIGTALDTLNGNLAEV